MVVALLRRRIDGRRCLAGERCELCARGKRDAFDAALAGLHEGLAVPVTLLVLHAEVGLPKGCGDPGCAVFVLVVAPPLLPVGHQLFALGRGGGVDGVERVRTCGDVRDAASGFASYLRVAVAERGDVAGHEGTIDRTLFGARDSESNRGLVCEWRTRLEQHRLGGLRRYLFGACDDEPEGPRANHRVGVGCREGDKGGHATVDAELVGEVEKFASG